AGLVPTQPLPRQVEALLAAGVGPNAAAADGATALALAAQQGHLRCVVQALLAAGANLEARDVTWGATALHWAANSDHLRVVQALLAAGADPRSVRPDGLTALMHPAERGHADVVRLLLASGVDVNARNKVNQLTALSWAQRNQRTQVVEILKAAGALP
ncbi:Palmitoyltransferase Hip14, partial [Gryllus bimaculatus]